MFSASEVEAFFKVIMIDLVMSGDNAIIIGVAAAGLAADLRKRAIVIGIAVAAVTRMMFAAVAFYLLQIVGLLLAGGLLLLWVAWTMWKQFRDQQKAEAEAKANGGENNAQEVPTKTFRQALIAIVVADVSMSLDNILAVTGAAHEHLYILIFGLALSVALMGVAANFIARVMERYKWIIYVGIALVTYVALEMIWRGGQRVVAEVPALSGLF
jgi:YjbE family integral membrane protein